MFWFTTRSCENGPIEKLSFFSCSMIWLRVKWRRWNVYLHMLFIYLFIISVGHIDTCKPKMYYFWVGALLKRSSSERYKVNRLLHSQNHIVYVLACVQFFLKHVLLYDILHSYVVRCSQRQCTNSLLQCQKKNFCSYNFLCYGASYYFLWWLYSRSPATALLHFLLHLLKT